MPKTPHLYPAKRQLPIWPAALLVATLLGFYCAAHVVLPYFFTFFSR